MKLNFGKRLVLFLHWLLSLAGCAIAVGMIAWPQLMQNISLAVNGVIGVGAAEIAGIAAAVLYVLLAVLSVVFIFSRDKKKGDRGFITVDSSEAGRTRIAIGAVEQMIRQAVRCVDGIVDMKSSIINNEDAISINTSVAIASGAHVPTVTMNIQRAIRSYIELNCGVAVREVSVSVHSLENPEETGKGRRKAVPAAAPACQPIAEPVQQSVPAVAQAPAVDESVQQEIVETAPEVAETMDEGNEATE